MVSTRRTILIVENDPEIRDALVLLLSLHQFVVRVAESREAAIQTLSFGQPDVVLLDWFMPGMPVEDFVTQARQSYASLQIVLMSGSLNTEKKAKELNLAYLVTKPFDADKALAVVDLCIRKRNQK